MTISDWVMVFVVLASPLLAVQATRWLDGVKEARARRVHLFKILMATRASNLSHDHVSALNLIDLEFDKAKGRDKSVIRAWKAYHAHLSDENFPADQWGTRRMDLLIELLYEMSTRLKYDFDKTHIRTSVYSPVAHGQWEDDITAIRRSFRELLEWKRPLPMHITNLPTVQHEQDTAA